MACGRGHVLRERVESHLCQRYMSFNLTISGRMGSSSIAICVCRQTCHSNSALDQCWSRPECIKSRARKSILRLDGRVSRPWRGEVTSIQNKKGVQNQNHCGTSKLNSQTLHSSTRTPFGPHSTCHHNWDTRVANQTPLAQHKQRSFLRKRNPSRTLP